MFSIHGTAIGGGIVIGRSRVLESRRFDVARYHVPAVQAEAEIARLAAAIADVKSELAAVGAHLPEDAPPEARALVEVHAMILDDPMLSEVVTRRIVADGWNAEWAVASQADELAAQFEGLEDAYLRERGRDVQQVADRVLKSLSGSTGRRLQDGGEPAIFVAHDIAPGDMLMLKSAVGFAIDVGGTTSHTAILARSMNVPAVVGLHCASELIADNEWLILDGDTGLVIVAPDDTVLDEYRHRRAASKLERERLKRLIHVPATTLDGVDIELHANIELPEEAVQAREAGATGIGLFRSEFLFMNRRQLPGEDEQYESYRSAVLGMRGAPVTIRTLDVGADKSIDDGVSGAQNPALGQRAIRYCLAEPEMFLIQLRAILRASAHGPVRLLIPMLAHHHEIESAIRLIDQAREQLRERRAAFDEHMPVGGMIEVPAAALSVGLFAQRLDFLSIGTNDLIQYTLAIDRTDHTVAALYDPFHPAVLKLIAMSIRAARRAGKPVAVCGELAGDHTATRLLLGMGLAEFSMHPASLLTVKREILLSDVSQLAPKVARLLATDDPRRVGLALSRLREDPLQGLGARAAAGSVRPQPSS